ncbi:hypothetical protein HMPREF1991_02649 [Hoylesella loescheii DSM 19665 = JCM 12249 = ATCC 15930]|uniref:Uncharacterized protein n=1 Tax=Hoylesella loescheii DSM 19665 = JCM 12249 = ATCC 15930 TaxID=1122985 RepID=A0A069QER4_HOYLO|nr:hypothetical protein HMPREF1991_02649 [Hoylesella loescheii DSM 19665 = JCM 12249 = ATCC 15930]
MLLILKYTLIIIREFAPRDVRIYTIASFPEPAKERGWTVVPFDRRKVLVLIFLLR